MSNPVNLSKDFQFTADDPTPYLVHNSTASAPILVVCDHASAAIPHRLNQLGLSENIFEQHVALDIGAGGVAKCLADKLDAQAILAGYSRLVIDCNRQIEDPSIILPVSDGITIPGNQEISDDERRWREQAIFYAYHKAIAREIADLRQDHIAPAIIAIHSFTPELKNQARPWQFGILWDKDPRIPLPLMKNLRNIDNVLVGDNEPYSGKHMADFTIDHHAEAAGLPHVSIEIRQDLISDEAGIKQWSELLFQALHPILIDEGLYKPQEFHAI
jgi:predicted N-formylglutamate amidohydrolase